MFRIPGVTSVLRLPRVVLQRALSQSASGAVPDVKQEVPVKQNFDNEPTRIKITLPPWSVGPLIGRKYKKLIQMKKDCNTNLKLSKLGNDFPGSTERVLLIEGETENVLSTIHKIYDTVRMIEIPEYLNSPDAAKRRQNGISLVTPLSFAEDLKGIERENESPTKKKFKLDQFDVFTKKLYYNKDFEERVIHIRGDEENVKGAVSFVVERLSSGPKVDRNLNYRFVNKPTRIIKITLPPWSVEPLKGPQYENMIQMKKDCSLTNLQLSCDFPGSLEPVLLIEGKIANVLKTIHKIYDTIRVMEISESVTDNPDAAKRRQNGIRLVTPLSFAEDFKRIVRENEYHTKTRFKLDQFDVLPARKPYKKDFKERVIYIRGDEKKVKDALIFVVERLNSGFKVDSNLDYQQYYV